MAFYRLVVVSIVSCAAMVLFSVLAIVFVGVKVRGSNIINLSLSLSLSLSLPPSLLLAYHISLFSSASSFRHRRDLLQHDPYLPPPFASLSYQHLLVLILPSSARQLCP
jgi:hypothetical protein